tara:strand:+ start:44400 stop:46178 length:1779 start_codon:yes stop_codon:yes gene_type:complete
MMRRICLYLFCSVFVSFCLAAPVPAGVDSSRQLHQIFNDFDAERDVMYPVAATFRAKHENNHRFDSPLSSESRAMQRTFVKKYLTQIQTIDQQKLSRQDQLSAQVFERNRVQSLRRFDYLDRYFPISQMGGYHLYYPQMGSGQSAQPFNTIRDYENFLLRTNGFVLWMDSAIEAMRQGVKAKVVYPKPIVEKLIPQLNTHVVDDPKSSVFYGPIKNLPDSFSKQDKLRLTIAYEAMILEQLVPVYQRFAEFLAEEYLPAARTSVGLSSLPGGKAWYDFEIESNTTLKISAEEVHALGLQEVAANRSRMSELKPELGYEGDLNGFFNYLRNNPEFYFDSAAETLQAYREVKQVVDKELPRLFRLFPKADYEIRPVEAYRAESEAGASYQPPAPDGTRPGIFYINTAPGRASAKFSLMTLSMHEAAPGHHFQMSIQQELTSLPAFRREAFYTAYIEGWALYAETLGYELGLYESPLMEYGNLEDAQLRAMRLVVDTGLHAFEWSREQAIAYMVDNSAMSPEGAAAEVERYMVLPGQALSYKLGQLKFTELRSYASNLLGEKFDVREFHRQLLVDGALPLNVLDTKIRRWVASQR